MIIIKEKNEKIQILRAIAIIAVILIHTCPPDLWQVFIRPFINFAVPIFLFIAGYLINIERTNWENFIKKRLLRVVIPYIIWTIIYTTFTFLERGIELEKYIINLLSTRANTSLYYIFVYIQFVLLTPFLSKTAKFKHNYIFFLIAPISCIIIKYYWLFSGVQPSKLISALFYVCCLPWFTYYYLGLLLGNKIIKKDFKIKKLLLVYIGTIIIQILEGYLFYKLGDDKCGTQIKVSAILTSSIFILMSYWYLNNKQISITNKLLLKIGDYSFGIYLSHILILKILLKFSFYSKIPFGLNSILILFLAFLLVLFMNKICNPKICKWFGLI